MIKQILKDPAIAGQLMTAMRATCKAGTEKLALRLVAAMYKWVFRCLMRPLIPFLNLVLWCDNTETQKGFANH